MGLVSLLFVLINFGNSFINTDYNTKRCSRKESYMTEGHPQYRAIYFCCGNHETIGNNCQECDVGFTSLNGDKCKKCTGRYYGKRCVELCKCSTDQWCDNILGCVPNLEESSHEKSLWTTDYVIKNYETTPDLSGKYGGSQASTNNNILIYLVCVFFSTIVMIFSNFCIRRIRQKEDVHVHRNHQIQGIRGNSIQDSGRCLTLSEHNEYEEIDETALAMNGILNKRGTKNYERSLSYEQDLISSDDYLNPYQPDVAFTDAHKCAKCIHISNKMKTSNSLPASLGCLKNILSNCNCFEPIKDRAGKILILHADQHRTAFNFLPKQNDRFCSLNQKRRRSI